MAFSALDNIRIAGENSLFYFARAILGLKFFTSFHQSLCNFLQDGTRPRKLALAPRDHGKTMCVKAQVLHMLIQPSDHNIYFPGTSGTECRIVIAGETSEVASRIVRVCKIYIEKNALITKLWPHLRPGARWTDNAITLERENNFSEPSVEAVGIESALASRHIDALFEEDIFTFRAMLSPTLAQKVTSWHQAAEGIMDEYENNTSREIVTGTPWSQNDVYRHIIENESSDAPDLIHETDDFANDPNLFTVYKRSCIENGTPIWPERFSLARIRRIERRLRGTGLFELNFLCDYEASTLTDFQRSWLRYFDISNGLVIVNGSVGPDIDVTQTSDTSPLAQALTRQMSDLGHETNAASMPSETPVATESRGINNLDVFNWLKTVMR